jgi:UDP-glucose 4-epimerase
MAESVYITGIAGFIGSTLAKYLYDDGYKVTGCDNLSYSDGSNLEGVSFPWELADCAKVEGIKADTIVHLAASTNATNTDRDEMMKENFDATMKLVNRYPDKRFIFASTCLVELPTQNLYATSKHLAETYIKAFDGDYVILRFGNVYGPNQRDWGPEPNVLAAWKKAVADGETLKITGDGKQSRDFIHVDDICEGIRATIAHPFVSKETIPLCTGVQHTINSLAELVYPQRTLEFVPRSPLDYDHIDQSPNEASRLVGFTAKRSVVDYKPIQEGNDE